MKPDADSVPKQRRYPVLSLLSLSMPFLGVAALVAFDATGMSHDWDRFSQWQAMVRIICSFLVVGLLLSCGSPVRRERWWGIAIAGALVNLVPLLACCLYS